MAVLTRLDDSTMPEFHLLKISEIHSHVGPIVVQALGPFGFSETAPLTWVNSEDAPIRRIFGYRQLKGGVIAPSWGYSFDFVPHISGGKMKWHRTEKSAIFDAFVDGQSFELNMSYMWGEEGLIGGMPSRIQCAVQKAKEFWSLGDKPEAVYAQVVALSALRGSQIYIQLPIAAAFCQALLGHESDAYRELALFADRSRLEEDCVQRLVVALKNAIDAGKR